MTTMVCLLEISNHSIYVKDHYSVVKIKSGHVSSTQNDQCHLLVNRANTLQSTALYNCCSSLSCLHAIVARNYGRSEMYCYSVWLPIPG